MITTTVLATLVAAQAQGAWPENAALVYSGIPGIVGSPTADVRMTSHSVTFELTKAAAKVTSVTLFHNDSAKPVGVALKLPIEAVHPVLGRGWDIDFTATLDGAPLKVGSWRQELAVDNDNKIVRYKVARAVFKVKDTHVLRISYEVPMGKGGLDGMQRLIAYQTAGALSWKVPMDRLNFTVHYGPSVVFHVVSAEPNWGWQIGDKGAFFKQDSFHPEGDTVARFVFYPGGYDKIGAIEK